MTNLVFDIKRPSFDEVHSLLKRMSAEFTPPLSQTVNLKEYSEKLSTKANFLTCEVAGKTIGVTAYYLNHSAKQIYITLICVDKEYQRTGVGDEMLKHLQQIAKDSCNEYLNIGLEVNKVNDKAFRFYVKHGFVQQEDRGNRFLMIKLL